MEFVGSYTFNRGQEITLWKGPRIYEASIQLWHAKGNPFKHIRGKDKNILLWRALGMVKKDVAKDKQGLSLEEVEGELLPGMKSQSRGYPGSMPFYSLGESNRTMADMFSKEVK